VRRFAAILAVVFGATLITFTFAQHLFSRSSDAQAISDHYAPLMSAAGLADLSNGFDAVKAAGGQLDTAAEPRLQTEMGLSDQAFAEYKRREMPGIAQFDAQATGVVKLVGPVIGQMQAERADYARASDIPVSWLPLSSAPWLFLGIGGLLVAVGAFALARPSKPATIALLIVGLGVAIAPLVIGIPSKVDAAVRVTKIGRVGLAPSTGQAAVGATKLFDNMVDDVQAKLQPAIDEHMGAGSFASNFPTLARFSDEWQRSTSAKSHALSDSQVSLSSTFANADSIPLRPIPWLFILPAIALALLAGGALLVSARSRQPLASSTPSTPSTPSNAEGETTWAPTRVS
jgi:hypothetical protein